jgi:hypothetical protein
MPTDIPRDSTSCRLSVGVLPEMVVLGAGRQTLFKQSYLTVVNGL